MTPDKFKSVTVLLGEPQRNLRLDFLNALRNFGFERVADVSGADGFEEVIARETPDIVIVDMALAQADTVKLLRRIRGGELGANPFVPMIVTAWSPTDVQVRQISQSGADDLLIKPIAPQSILDRVWAAAVARKPFVVTSDYIGPDRRKASERVPNDPRLIDVPNPLKAKVSGQPVPAISNMIEETQRRINEERLDRNAEKVSMLVTALLPSLKVDEELPDNVRPLVEQLHRVATEMGQRLKGSKFDHISALSQSMIKVAASIRDSDELAQKDIQLLQPLSMAILKGMRPNADEAALARDIANQVANFKRHSAGGAPAAVRPATT